MTYTCRRCGKIFKQRGHLAGHLSRKVPCLPNISDIEPEELIEELGEQTISHKCAKCHCTFSSQYGLRYHVNMNVCDKSAHNTEPSSHQSQGTINNFIVVNNVHTMHNTLGNGNTIIQNPYVNTTHMFDAKYFTAVGKRDFGEERLDYFTYEDIQEFINNPYDLGRFIQHIYFNPKHVENNTVVMYCAKKNQFLVVKRGIVVIEDIYYVCYKIKEKFKQLVEEHWKDHSELLDRIIHHENEVGASSDYYYDVGFFTNMKDTQQWNVHYLRKQLLPDSNILTGRIATSIQSSSRPVGPVQKLPLQPRIKNEYEQNQVPETDDNFWPRFLVTDRPKYVPPTEDSIAITLKSMFLQQESHEVSSPIRSI